jgi:hypothetical protein
VSIKISSTAPRQDQQYKLRAVHEATLRRVADSLESVALALRFVRATQGGTCPYSHFLSHFLTSSHFPPFDLFSPSTQYLPFGPLNHPFSPHLLYPRGCYSSTNLNNIELQAQANMGRQSKQRAIMGRKSKRRAPKRAKSKFPFAACSIDVPAYFTSSRANPRCIDG